MAKKTIKRPWTSADARLLKQYSRAKTPVAKIARQMRRTVGALRQPAFKRSMPLGHRR